MARILEALLRAGGEESPVQPTSLAESPPAAEEEVPFIEIGPHRSIEASPSVLAAAPPRPAAPAPAPAVTLKAATTPAVSFRALRAHPAGPPRAPRFPPGLVAHHAPDLPASAAYRDLLEVVLAATGRADRPALLLTAAQDRKSAV